VTRAHEHAGTARSKVKLQISIRCIALVEARSGKLFSDLFLGGKPVKEGD